MHYFRVLLGLIITFAVFGGGAIYYAAKEINQVEITEQLLVEANQSTILQALKNIGFSISLNDFGTGYSVLSYLTSVPLDTLKIDRSFIDKILEGTEQDRHILEAIIQIATALNMEIVPRVWKNPNRPSCSKPIV